jgi:cyclophilin family peptidyl-prolyl cis-trans isomerase
VPKVAAAMTDRRRRQKEQRAAKREAEKKQNARRELGRRLGTALIFGVLLVAVLAIGAFFGDDEGDLPRGYEGFRAQPTACEAEQPPPELVAEFSEPEDQTDVTPSAVVTATLQTSCGDIVIELDPADYPETVNSFVFLAREGFYNGQVFHRIVADFQAFAGDPLADGTGGPGYRIPDEFPPEDFVYTPGVVAMDNVGKGTTGSQFFIVLGEAADVLNPQFNVLGNVVSGQETLDRIQEVETARRPGSVEDSLPLQTVYIENVTIDVTGS